MTAIRIEIKSVIYLQVPAITLRDDHLSVSCRHAGMTDTAFEKLTAMWRSGEINEDEFKLATRYLREEQAKVRASSGKSDRRRIDRRQV